MSSTSPICAETTIDYTRKQPSQAFQPKDTDSHKSSLTHTHCVYTEPSTANAACITQHCNKPTTPSISTLQYRPSDNDNWQACGGERALKEQNSFEKKEKSIQATQCGPYVVATPSVGGNRTSRPSYIFDGSDETRTENIGVFVDFSVHPCREDILCRLAHWFQRQHWHQRQKWQQLRMHE